MLYNISDKIKEAALFLSYDAERDPLVVNLKKAITAIEAGNWPVAKNWISHYQVRATIENRIRQYETIPAFKTLKEDYKTCVEMVEKKDPAVVEAINKIIDAHKKSKHQIEQLQGIVR
jgi:hypothetical protein